MHCPETKKTFSGAGAARQRRHPLKVRKISRQKPFACSREPKVSGDGSEVDLYSKLLQGFASDRSGHRIVAVLDDHFLTLPAEDVLDELAS